MKQLMAQFHKMTQGPRNEKSQAGQLTTGPTWGTRNVVPSLKRHSYKFTVCKQTGRECGTVVELKPHVPVVMDSNPAGYWAFFFLNLAFPNFLHQQGPQSGANIFM